MELSKDMKRIKEFIVNQDENDKCFDLDIIKGDILYLDDVTWSGENRDDVGDVMIVNIADDKWVAFYRDYDWPEGTWKRTKIPCLYPSQEDFDIACTGEIIDILS